MNTITNIIITLHVHNTVIGLHSLILILIMSLFSLFCLLSSSFGHSLSFRPFSQCALFYSLLHSSSYMTLHLEIIFPGTTTPLDPHHQSHTASANGPFAHWRGTRLRPVSSIAPPSCLLHKHLAVVVDWQIC